MKPSKNQLLSEWTTPFGIPPFDDIAPEQFIPAIEKAISMARQEIDAVANDNSTPTFSNTIEPLESSGKHLNRISNLLFNLNSAETNPEIQEATRIASPILTRFSNDITLNRPLFSRISEVYSSVNWSQLADEQSILLKDKYRAFRNGGAELTGKKRERFRTVSEELSRLTVKFEENLLDETNSFELHLTSESDLKGLPEGLIEQASEVAKERGKDGWIFTLHYPSYVPFMQYAENRRLRKKMFIAYSTRCSKGNEWDNSEIVTNIVNLRLELANLLGYNSYADYILEDRMASSQNRVNEFLTNLYKSAFPFALKDYSMIETFAREKGHKGNIEKWDWAYYAEWLKRELYSIDDQILKPYFRLESVERAVFKLAEKLFEIQFKELTGIKGYHKEVRTFEVTDLSRKHIAILMVDYHPRKGKSGGAWMTAYREQFNDNGKDVRPIVSIVMNFNRSTSSKPSLLTHNELTTLLHEFGHALHGMLSRCIYESNSGTNVKRDFVELPSQLMENWAYEKEWLDQWAVHFETGEKIPPKLIEKIIISSQYNEGYACNRQISFGMLDMAWHSITKPFRGSVSSFEKTAISKTELFNPVKGANQSCAFGHLFSGGYAAGYYGYKWAEVLDADAFSIFKERGIFDHNTANNYKKQILEKGGSSDPMTLYKNFRGAEPSIDALLKRSGFINK